MKKVIVTLKVNHSAKTLSNKCHGAPAECPIGACVCPFEDTPCKKVTPEQWQAILKEEDRK